MSKIKPIQAAMAGPANVIWLKALHWRGPPGSAGRRPDAREERLREVLTAMAGLDALELALLGATPAETQDDHCQLMATRLAAMQSRRALHDAHPALSSVEAMEILHVVHAVRSVATDPGVRPAMAFEAIPPRGMPASRWGIAAFALMLMSIQCMVTVHGSAVHERNRRSPMTSLPANVPPAAADAEQRADGPRHTEMPPPIRGHGGVPPQDN